MGVYSVWVKEWPTPHLAPMLLFVAIVSWWRTVAMAVVFSKFVLGISYWFEGVTVLPVIPKKMMLAFVFIKAGLSF